MLPTVLLALAVGYAPIDVSLDDLNRFKITPAEVGNRRAVGNQFQDFTYDVGLGLIDSKTSGVYLHLEVALNPADTLQGRLASLRCLRKELGQKDYDAGNLPPPYPAKYKRQFEQWQKNRERDKKRGYVDDGKKRL